VAYFLNIILKINYYVEKNKDDGTTCDIDKTHLKSLDMSIQIQVARCTQCKGYTSAAPLEQKHNNHPDIIDHFFYHGEPAFTLDQKTFEKFRNLENTEVTVMDLHEHEKNDHQHCNCIKKPAQKTVHSQKEIFSLPKNPFAAEKHEMDNEIYFKDLYYTYNNFHGISSSNHYVNSGRKFR
jgi:hypothetical protein